MKNNSLPQLVLIAVVVIVGFVFLSGSDLAPVRPYPKPTGPDMIAVFAANTNRAEATEHAAIFGSVCRAIANQLEYDGLRGEKARYKTGVAIDDLRIRLREYRMGGWSFATKYPSIGQTVEGYMEAQLGKSGGPVTADQRRAWCETFRSLGKCCDYASTH